VTCSNSEALSEILNRFDNSSPWTWDQPDGRPLLTQNDNYKRPCLKQDSNPRTQRLSDQDLRLRPRGHGDRLLLNCAGDNFEMSRMNGMLRNKSNNRDRSNDLS
jgi:hypothetical protein